MQRQLLNFQNSFQPPNLISFEVVQDVSTCYRQQHPSHTNRTRDVSSKGKKSRPPKPYKNAPQHTRMPLPTKPKKKTITATKMLMVLGSPSSQRRQATIESTKTKKLYELAGSSAAGLHAAVGIKCSGRSARAPRPGPPRHRPPPAPAQRNHSHTRGKGVSERENHRAHCPVPPGQAITDRARTRRHAPLALLCSPLVP
jgi:hypothetical protein